MLNRTAFEDFEQSSAGWKFHAGEGGRAGTMVMNNLGINSCLKCSQRDFSVDSKFSDLCKVLKMNGGVWVWPRKYYFCFFSKNFTLCFGRKMTCLRY